jgi:hypothetical protein
LAIFLVNHRIPGQWKKSANKLEGRPRKVGDEKCKTPQHGAVSLRSSIRGIFSQKSKEFIMMLDTKVITKCKITFHFVSAKFHKLFCRGSGELISLDLFLSPKAAALDEAF